MAVSLSCVDPRAPLAPLVSIATYASTAVLTWITTFVILYALAAIGLNSFQALDVPPGM